MLKALPLKLIRIKMFQNECIHFISESWQDGGFKNLHRLVQYVKQKWHSRHQGIIIAHKTRRDKNSMKTSES